jgi:hypothetical protein
VPETKGNDVADQGNDRSVLEHIQHLVAEEHRLFERRSLDASESNRLAAVKVELDQCWDLLRQRRALRETGHKASEAHVRPPEVVEKYVG